MRVKCVVVNRLLVAAGHSEERSDVESGVVGCAYLQISHCGRNDVRYFHLDALLDQSSDTESPGNLRVLAPCCLFRKDLTPALPAAISATPQQWRFPFWSNYQKTTKIG